MHQERIYQVLLGPHISEKATRLAEERSQYVFKVARTATKLEIQKSVEQLFEVTVKSVKTAVVKGKTKRTRLGLGRRSDWKKAYVCLEQGQEIEYAGGE